MIRSNPSETGTLPGMGWNMRHEGSVILLTAKITMSDTPDPSRYIGDRVILANEVRADCCERCPYEGKAWTRHPTLLNQNDRPIPVRCGGLHLPYSALGNIMCEKGDPYMSHRQLEVNANFECKTPEDARKALATILGREPLLYEQKINMFPHDISPKSLLPCARGGHSQVTVYTRDNPPRRIKGC